MLDPENKGYVTEKDLARVTAYLGEELSEKVRPDPLSLPPSLPALLLCVGLILITLPPSLPPSLPRN
jgi:hypothetical protein